MPFERICNLQSEDFFGFAMRQLGRLSMLKMMVEQQNAQFVIATRSLMLIAFPNATIYSFDTQPIRQIAYHEAEHVQVMKSFLENPQCYLRHV